MQNIYFFLKLVPGGSLFSTAPAESDLELSISCCSWRRPDGRSFSLVLGRGKLIKGDVEFWTCKILFLIQLQKVFLFSTAPAESDLELSIQLPLMEEALVLSRGKLIKGSWSFDCAK